MGKNNRSLYHCPLWETFLHLWQHRVGVKEFKHLVEENNVFICYIYSVLIIADWPAITPLSERIIQLLSYSTCWEVLAYSVPHQWWILLLFLKALVLHSSLIMKHPYRCLTWSSPMWPCVCLFTSPMCSTPPWEPVAGSTLTYSQSCASLSCTTRPFSGRTESAAPRRPSYRVSSKDCENITVCVSGFSVIQIENSFSRIQCVCVCFCQVRCIQPACVSMTRDVW